MRKFTTLILSLLMLTIAFPFVGWSQEEDQVIYYDSKGYILDSPDHVRLDVPVIDRSMGARDVTCNIPEVRFTGLAQEVFPSVNNTFVARVYSHGYEDKLCAVYYDTYYKTSENASETTVSSISTYGSIKFNIRLQGDDNQDVNITNGSGQVSFTYSLLFFTYNVKALSLGIIDNYCVGRNRPLNFTYNLTKYGVYRMHYKIVNCTNSSSTIPGTNYTSNGAECCSASGTSHRDYYATSCTKGSTLYETDMYMRVVSTKLLAHPQGGEICPGGSKTLSVSAETCLSNGITYQWYKWNDGVPETINGATTNTYVATEAGEYYCVTNDGREPRETEHAVITVTQMPEVDLAADQFICPNGSLDLTMPAGAAYRWSDNSTDATLHVTTPNTYSVTMTSNGCSAAYSFNVQQLSDVDLITNTSETLCPGTTLTETLSVDNATDIVWNNNASLNQSSLPITEAGTYTVSANVNGCPFTDAVEVVAPQYGELINDETVQICEGASYQVTLNSNELSNIVWGGDATGNEATKTFTQPGTYSVSALYQGCTLTDSFTLSFKPVPAVEEPASQIICANSTVELTMPECDSYQWSDAGNSTTQTLAVTAPGEYTVTMTANGCEFSRTFSVEAAPIYNILADDAVTICYGTTETLELAVDNATNIVWNNDPANNGQAFVISEGGTYTVSAKIGECTYTDQIIATQTENVNLIADETVSFCYGTTQTLALAVNSATEIVWNNDPANNAQTFVINQGGTYTVSAKVDGCTYTDQIVATQFENVNLLTDETVNICYGTTETLELAVDNATDIVWNNDPANNGQTFVISEGGTYTVSANVGGCTFTDQIVATQSGNVNLIADETVNFCYGATETLELAVNNATEIVWNNDPSNNGQTFVINQSGTYPVSAKVDGCTYTDQIVATQSENVNLIADETVNFCYGATETLELAVNNATEIVWNNDPANNGQTFVINQSGTYPVSAKVDGCTYTDQIVATQGENVNLIADETVNFCYGTTETLELAVNNATEIVWNNDPANNGQTFVINQSGTYPVSAKVDGCTYTDQIVATQTENVNLIADETVSFCYGATETLELAVNNATEIVWNNDPANNGQTFVISEAGTYNVSAKVDGCTYTDQIVATQSENVNLIADETVNFCYGTTQTLALAVNNATEIVWNNDPANNGQTFVISEGGTYNVSAKVNGCTYTDQIVANQTENVNLLQFDNIQFCYGNSATLELTVNNATNIVWNNDPSLNGTTLVISELGTYTVEADVDGCHYTDQIVAVETQNYNLISEESVVICYGSSVTLSLPATAMNAEWNNNPELNQNTLEISEAGTYTVSADYNGCRYNDQVVATVAPELIVAVNAGTITCTEPTTTAEAIATGGTAPYAFAWSNAEATQSIEATAGIYTLTVTDDNGCVVIASTTIEEPAAIAAEINAGTINCNGGTTLAEVEVNGGVAPFAFAWSNGATTQSIDAAAGIYTVAVTDANGCVANATVSIEEPVALTVSINAGAINCNGGTSTVMANVTGGTAPYVYSWNNNAATQSIEVAAGEYSVVVTDANNCTISTSVNITEPATLTAEISAGSITCVVPTTTAEAVVTGGTEPYAFAWNNNAVTQSIEVAAGEYSVVVTDANNCTASANVNIAEPAAISAEINAGTINCNNGTTLAEVEVNGGVAPFAFAWSNGATTQSIDAAAGIYTVAVTDANGCVTNATVSIEEPVALTVSISAGTINCNGGTSTVEANVTGGTAPYVYAWNNNAATQSIEVAAGEYSVVVTDANNCTISTNVNIPEPATLTAEISAGSITCVVPTTTAEAVVTGGTEPYAFAWNNNAVTQSIEVAAGEYSVVVTDANNCTASANVNIAEPAAIAAEINAGTINCNGGTANAEVVVNGGVAPFAFAWSNGATTQSIDAAAGIYTVAVTDANGCVANATVSIEEPVLLAVSISAGTINCNGGTTTVEANVTGGTTPYALAWSNDETTQNITATAGEYSLTVTDANGCSATVSTVIEEPAAFSVSIIAGTISCNGGTTMAVAHTNGGVAPYSYAWSNQGTAQNVSNIVAGEYSVTVVDNNGCSAITSVTVTEPEYVNLIADETVNFCEGSSVTVTLVEGATNVVWNNSEIGANNEIGIAGTYTVEADVNGCHYTDQVTAVANALPVSGLERTYSMIITNADTTIVIAANEGYASYLWSNGGTENSLSIYCDTLVLPFDADYNLNITSESGCSSVDTISVHVEMSPSSVSEFEVYEWNVVPNPNDGNFEIVGSEFDKAELYDSNGRFIALIESKDVSLSDVKPGMYYLRIYSEGGVSMQKVLINK